MGMEVWEGPTLLFWIFPLILSLIDTSLCLLRWMLNPICKVFSTIFDFFPHRYCLKRFFALASRFLVPLTLGLSLFLTYSLTHTHTHNIFFVYIDLDSCLIFIKFSCQAWVIVFYALQFNSTKLILVFVFPREWIVLYPSWTMVDGSIYFLKEVALGMEVELWVLLREGLEGKIWHEEFFLILIWSWIITRLEHVDIAAKLCLSEDYTYVIRTQVWVCNMVLCCRTQTFEHGFKKISSVWALRDTYSNISDSGIGQLFLLLVYQQW